MKINLKEITVKELTKDYEENVDGGVIGYGGKLNVRPQYQREFIYKDEQRDSVINTVTKNFPLNVMYWAVHKDGNYEVIDGQQRTISICRFVKGDFSFHKRGFINLQNDEQKQILDYKLMVYLCSGTDSEKLEWFKTINIAGEKLTNQELRNAVYSGSWITDAKRYFSKNGCVAHKIGSKYLSGNAIRQEYLETVIKWINNHSIEKYMAQHQHDKEAKELWLYFQNVITWVKKIFPNYRKEMKGVSWGTLYNELKNKKLNPNNLEEKVSQLMRDDDVGNRSGIYSFVLTGQEKYLNIRQFTDNQKGVVYEKQKGICPMCKEHFGVKEMEADHITPWHEGGKTILENCQMLCKEDNRRKGGK